MQYAVAQGCETLVEVGPGNVLSGLMRRIDRGVEVLTVAQMLERAS